MALRLTSPAFAQGVDIPKKYTCDGDNISPPFEWSGAPDGTQSFLLVCDDVDAPEARRRHWAAYNIPAHCTGLREGQGPESLADGFQQAINDFNAPGYAAPCPTWGAGRHNYHFRLSALSEATLPVASSATCKEVIAVARPYVLEFVELIGTYARD